ncbi:MAG: thioredoxin domain-containing protein [Tissierellia bacterium]|nr:thioredoxin domain-containing protein [Tissierellia bacterium]
MDIYTNKLIDETSPYLLQHAHNPVNWFPWDEDAFELAKTEDKPIFLSIGYSTCHWCHVMAEESFEDEDVAKLLNEHFVSIKVDREERPDIDSIYMEVTQALTGSGGWPMTVIITPDKKPFYAGTYFPKESKYGRVGIIELLSTIADKWESNRDELIDSSNKITDVVRKYNNVNYNTDTVLKDDIVDNAVRDLKRSFDIEYGGFGSAPKFPTPHKILFLLHAYKLGIGDSALEMAEKTLLSMYSGGLYDHIGYGFSRYSTDAKWLVPHFEKMLYDNALLIIAYSEAYQITKKPIYKYIVDSTIDYIKNEMTNENGGFYSAQDADSEGVEGKYYTWSYDEVIDILGDSGLEFSEKYNITQKGNFEGSNILNLIGKDIEVPDTKLQSQFKKLYEYRKNRMKLHTDDKILLSWNAMMITALVKSAKAFNNDDYLESAINAYDFIKTNMINENGILGISYREGKLSGDGLLDDYSYLLWASIELYESTFDKNYLEDSMELYNAIQEMFYDGKGAYYLSPSNASDLLYRPREFYDGATPSGNSVLAYALVKLHKITGNIEIKNSADKLLSIYSSMFNSNATAHAFALKGLLLDMYKSSELVAKGNDATLSEIKEKILVEYNPQLSIIYMNSESGDKIDDLIVFVKEYKNVYDTQTFYLCQNYTCLNPVNNLEDIVNNL